MQLTPVEWKEWANMPATQELLVKLMQARFDSMEKWAMQGYETERNNDFALGGIASINEVIDYIEDCKHEE